ncbi:MAG: helix-turn-helix domain-containing protein [Porticoccus sp.]|uniref:STY4528 family pathogenicity island replication protein n=1 Tax=Porticoccus hydrocarbonoclasticus TaxID=1073414 RepID=UPI000C5EDCE1|nr:STY4528 family pathogenicity island replication protein [Porticoccus hydrocarbonoclasticus]MBG58080.1 helix-turn-helix domain-containing protein [Porticoccus sp.]|tara:strand:- start:11086 stop:12354 length:1269 start_codon:yes stop_codon:yes gene_type:complete
MPQDDDLRPETVALDALIKATVQRVKNQPDAASPDAMLFVGNWHQAIPALVIQDPVLEPVDKLVWMVIMLHARETGGRTAFPSYETIACKSNVSSTSTISRAIAILRLTRWLTLCAKVRQKSGRFTGNVYVLHDEPLPLADALYLDQSYMTYVQESQEHHHARVRRIAQAVVDTLDQDVQQGKDLSNSGTAIERRLQAANVLGSVSKNRDKDGRYFTFNASVIRGLKNAPETRGEDKVGQYQKSKTEEKEHYSSGCSSHYKKTTTTTTTQNTNTDKKELSESDKSSKLPSDQTLIYPPRLSDNQKILADRYLALVAPEDRQLLLDELQGRLESEQKGMKPVYDELRFLHSLCKAAQQGEFVPNLGIKVVEARQSRRQSVEPVEDDAQKAKSAEEQERSKAYGLEQLAKLRASLDLEDKSQTD